MSRRIAIISEAYTSANPTQATIVGDRLDCACHDIRDFLSRNQIAFEWFDPAAPADAAARAIALTRPFVSDVYDRGKRESPIPINVRLTGAIRERYSPGASLLRSFHCTTGAHIYVF